MATTRYIKIEDEKLAKYLEEKNLLVKDGRNLNADIEKIQTVLNKIALKIQKLKDKIIPRAEEYCTNLGEFEELVTINMEDGKVVLEILDRVEEYKALYLERKNKKNEDTANKS